MKRIILIFGIAVFLTNTDAQTRVEKVIPAKASGEGVTYSLPVTSLVIEAEVREVTVKTGPYYRYAERYLGLKNVVTKDAVYYELGKISLINKGIPDPNNTYKIKFKQKTVAPFVYLTQDGLLCAVNEEYTPAQKDDNTESFELTESNSSASSVYTEELLIAGSVAKQAEVAAKQIYHLRESRTDILTGDADNIPPDGEAMKIVINGLEEQEKSLVQLFSGTETSRVKHFKVSIVPQEELKDEVLFRFSSKLGFLDADDLAGEPVYLDLNILEQAPVLDPKEAKKKEKSLKGIIYNVPGRAYIEIKHKNRSLLKKETPIVQFGSKEALAPVILEDKKQPVRVLFYPEIGAIKQITK